jgi:hypothetical protein
MRVREEPKSPAVAQFVRHEIASLDQRVAELLADPPAPLFGLPLSWTGARSYGDVEWANGAVERIGLAHGNMRRDGEPLLHVVTLLGDPLPLSLSLRRYVESDPRGPAGEDDFRGWPSAGNRLVIPVAGEPVEFTAARGTSGWCALAPMDGCTLSIEAHHFAPADVELVRITDAEPYLRGRRELMQELGLA